MEANVHGARIRQVPQSSTSGEPPLFNRARRFGVLWSPKSASATTLVWFINTLGRLEEARRLHHSPHTWRLQVYNREPQWQESVRALDQTWKMLRIIRDPYARAISSYRQALQFSLEVPRLTEFLGHPLRGGYSLIEFLDFLLASDIHRLDPHMRPQRHAMEAWRGPDRVINVSRKDLFAGLNEFEAEIGMPQTDFGKLAWIHEVEGRRRMDPIDIEGDVSAVRFSSIFAKNGGSWPVNKAFLNPQTRSRIEKAYAIDFAAYGPYL